MKGSAQNGIDPLGQFGYWRLVGEILDGKATASPRSEESVDTPVRRSWSLRALFARDNERGKR